MKEIFINCSGGISGDMLLAALLDLGVPLSTVEASFSDLTRDTSCKLDVKEVSSFGLRGLKVDIESSFSGDKFFLDNKKKSFTEIKEYLMKSKIRESIKKNVLDVFTLLAEAESLVHGNSINSVHFHEIGSLDSFLNILGVCSALDYLKPIKVLSESPPSGSGFVNTSHGFLPVPVPTVLEIARLRDIPLLGSNFHNEGEVTTPTGIALLAILVDNFLTPKIFHIEALGIGIGHRELERPNLLRIFELRGFSNIAQKEINHLSWQPLVSQEAWIDDLTPEDLAILLDNLRAEGALDVACQPIQMKKNRQGFSIKALVEVETAERLRDVWFSFGTTLGLRENNEGRWTLPRRLGTCKTILGLVKFKQFLKPDGTLIVKPEHDELVRLSEEIGVTLSEIRKRLLVTPNEFIPDGGWSR
tara:strand:- start:511 stop:1758 length:1248 start_codon:yes stop_codon:yes gene_type:complete